MPRPLIRRDEAVMIDGSASTFTLTHKPRYQTARHCTAKSESMLKLGSAVYTDGWWGYNGLHSHFAH
jgi:hypothetical protein